MVVVSEFLDVGWYVPGRTGLLTRLISFLIKWRLYPRSFQKVYSFIAALIEEIVSGADGRRRKARLKGMVRFVWAGWQKVFLEDIGACLTVLCGDQFLFGYC